MPLILRASCGEYSDRWEKIIAVFGDGEEGRADELAALCEELCFLVEQKEERRCDFGRNTERLFEEYIGEFHSWYSLGDIEFDILKVPTIDAIRIKIEEIRLLVNMASPAPPPPPSWWVTGLARDSFMKMSPFELGPLRSKEEAERAVEDKPFLSDVKIEMRGG